MSTLRGLSTAPGRPPQAPRCRGTRKPTPDKGSGDFAPAPPLIWGKGGDRGAWVLQLRREFFFSPCRGTGAEIPPVHAAQGLDSAPASWVAQGRGRGRWGARRVGIVFPLPTVWQLSPRLLELSRTTPSSKRFKSETVAETSHRCGHILLF